MAYPCMSRMSCQSPASPPGKLPGPQELRGGAQGRYGDFAARLEEATREVVRRQKRIGLDIIGDGELGKAGPFVARLANYGPRELRPAEDARQAGTPRGEWKTFPTFY